MILLTLALVLFGAIEVTTIIAIAAAIAAPLGAYLVAARRFSGQITSSDATELWAESRSIRDWSERRIALLDQRVVDLSKENVELLKEISALRLQVQVLTDDLVQSRALIKKLQNGKV